MSSAEGAVPAATTTTTASGGHLGDPLVVYEYLEPRTFAWRWTLATLLLGKADASSAAPDTIATASTTTSVANPVNDGELAERVVRVQPWRMSGRLGPTGGLTVDTAGEVLLGAADLCTDGGTSDALTGASRKARHQLHRLTAKTDAGRRLAEEMAAKQAVVEARMAEVRIKMEALRDEQAAAAAEQARMEAALGEARAELTRAREQVEKIDVQTLKEIQSYRTPPAVVLDVMTAVFNVLGSAGAALSAQGTPTLAQPTEVSLSVSSAGSPTSSSASHSYAHSNSASANATAPTPAPSPAMPRVMPWPEIVSRLRNPAFLPTVLAFDPERDLPADRRAKLHRRYIVRPTFDYAAAVKGSQAMGDLYNWVIRQLEATSAATRLGELRRETTACAAEALQKRAQIATAAAELDTMAEELDSLEEAYAEAEAAARLATGDGEDLVELAATATTVAFSDGTASPAADLRSPVEARWGSSGWGGGGSSTGSTAAAAGDVRALLRGVRKPWRRPGTVTSTNTTHILRSSLLCELGPSPVPGATVELEEGQQAAVEAALRARYAEVWRRRSASPAALVTRSTESPEPVANTNGSACMKTDSTTPATAVGGEEPLEAERGDVHAELATLLAELDEGAGGAGERSAAPAALTEVVAQLTERVHDLRARLRAQTEHDMRATVVVVDTATTTANSSITAPGSFARSRQDSAMLRPPLCELTTSTLTHDFPGDEWALVLSDSEEALRRAIANDVAAICGVPNRAVSALVLALGSLHATFTLEHHVGLSPGDIQMALDTGAYPETEALYEARHARRAEQDAEVQHREEQAAQLARVERELANTVKEKQTMERRLATREQQLARREKELAEAQTALTTQQTDMQRLVAQSSSQAEVLDELREQLAFRDTVRKTEELQKMLQDREEQLVVADAVLREKESELELSHARAERRFRQQLEEARALHKTESERLQQELREAKAQQAALEVQVAEAASAAARAPPMTANDVAASREPEVEAEVRATAAAVAAEEKAAAAEARQCQAEEELRRLRDQHALVTTHHTHTLAGDEWGAVLENSREKLERCLRSDLAAVCGVPSKAVTHLELAPGPPFLISFTVTHTAALDAEALTALLRAGEYPSAQDLYHTHARLREVEAVLQVERAARARLESQQAAMAQERAAATATAVQNARVTREADAAAAAAAAEQQQQQQQRDRRLAVDAALIAALEESLQAQVFGLTYCARETTAMEEARAAAAVRQGQRQAEADRVRQAMVELTSGQGKGGDPAVAVERARASVVRDLAALLRAVEADVRADEESSLQGARALRRVGQSIEGAQERVDVAEATRKAAREAAKRTSSCGVDSPTEPATRRGTEPTGANGQGPRSESDGEGERAAMVTEGGIYTNGGAAAPASGSGPARVPPTEVRRAHADTRRAQSERIASLREAAKAQRRAWKEQSQQLIAAREAVLAQSRAFLDHLTRDLRAPPGEAMETGAGVDGRGGAGSRGSRHSLTLVNGNAALWRGLYEEAVRRSHSESVWMHVFFGGVIVAALVSLRYKQFST